MKWRGLALAKIRPFPQSTIMPREIVKALAQACAVITDAPVRAIDVAQISVVTDSSVAEDGLGRAVRFVDKRRHGVVSAGAVTKLAGRAEELGLLGLVGPEPDGPAGVAHAGVR